MESQNIVTKKHQTLANAEEQHLAAMSTSTTKVTTKTTKKVSSKKKAALKTTISLSVEANSTESEMDALIKANDQQQQQQIAECIDESATKSKVTKKKATTSATTTVSSNSTASKQTVAEEKQQQLTTMISVTKIEESTLTSADTTSVASISPDGVELNEKKKLKSKKSKKSDADKQNISVKSSFSKFDALQKRNLIHVRSSSSAGKAQEKFSNPQGEKEINCRLCSKPVYKMEEIKAEKSIFHKNCFRCKECDKQLKVDNYQSHEGILYCMLHFKLLFAPKCVEDNEPEKPRKHELIIRESQPIELPPDVVRASDKPDLGLEELQQLNVRSRFKVFENGVQQKTEEKTTVSRNVGGTTIKRSGSLLSKLAKLQSLGFSAGISEDDMAAEAADSSCSDDENATSDLDADDIELVRSKKSTQRERPVGIGKAMDDIKTKFEKGHGKSKEERREERKQEIQNIRSRLFMGKQARIKEMYQQAVADSEQSITSVNKKSDIEIDGGAARSLKERFEKGDMFKDTRLDNEDEGNRTGGIQNEADVFESAISKKSRSIFMELDANVTAGKNEVPRSPQPNAIQRNRSSVLTRYNSDSEQENNPQQQQDAADVVKCDEKADDVQVETADISQKFKFFETYRPTEGKRKQFRITPPREGVVKMPTPESDTELIEKTEDTNAIEKSHTTSMMLNKFREMEQSHSNNRSAGPKPLKCFTPPPDGPQDDTETDEDEEGDEEDYEEEDDEFNDVYRRSNMHADDEALKEAQVAARAKQLRAKFEKWEANEVQREINEGHINIYSDQVSDDTTIESTKSIRDRFENMKNSERKSPTRRYQVNRFVEADIPIDIHTLKLQDWLFSRRIVPKSIQASIKDIRGKIANAIQDMPSNEQLIKLLEGTNINYYHCKEIIEILKQTEKDTKSVFGTYGSQRMRDWQEVVRLYERDAVYLAESAQIYVRNVNYEIPGLRKQMTKLEQQADECLKRTHELGKPEAQLLAEHAQLLQQLGVRGDNLREEFTQVLTSLPELYAKSIHGIGAVQKAIDFYEECGGGQNLCPILRHLIEFGNTTVFQFLHKEEPLTVEPPPIKLNLSAANTRSDAGPTTAADDNGLIDFGAADDNGGTSSTISAEVIDFGDFNLETGDGSAAASADDIDWGIGSTSTDAVEINFDIPIEEFGIVVEGVGMDGGTAKGDQAYTLLDSPQYRDRFQDELHELDAFLRMRLYELNAAASSAASNVMFSLLDSISTHDAESIGKMLTDIDHIIQETGAEQTRHLFQLKHSPKYADLLASKLNQMSKAVEKIRATKEVLRTRSLELKQQRLDLNPVLTELTKQTKQLKTAIERDISKRYKNRVVNLMGGV